MIKLLLACLLLFLLPCQAQEKGKALNVPREGVLCELYNDTADPTRQPETIHWHFFNNDTLCSDKDDGNSTFVQGFLVSINVSFISEESGRVFFILYHKLNDRQISLPTSFKGFTSLFSESNQTFCNDVAPEDLSSSPSPVALCINVSPFGASIIYQLLVEPITGFVLRIGSSWNVTVGANSPAVYYYKFPDHIENIQVTVKSPPGSNNCALVSIRASCSFDISTANVMTEREGVIYQTMSNLSSIFVSKKNYSEFFVVIGLKPPSECNPEADDNSDNEYHQSYSINIEEAKTATAYKAAISSPVILFVIIGAVCIAMFSCSCCQTLYCRTRTFVPCWCLRKHSLFASSVQRERQDRNTYESIGGTEMTDSNRYILDQREAEVNLPDLMKTKEEDLRRYYNGYFWNIITIGIFYGLPAFQLVLAKQLLLENGGNQDICYFNFECSKHFGSLSAFNNNWSNIGYVILGVSFLIIVAIKHRNEKRNRAASTDSNSKGLPQFFGTYYAMGSALIAEGFMSAFYHTCPSHYDFQFDTAFMFIISGLLIIKIVQARHPDLYYNAFITLLCLAVIVLLTFIGIVEESRNKASVTLDTKLVLFFIFLLVVIFFNISYYFYLGCQSHLWLSKRKICEWFKKWYYPKLNWEPRHKGRFIKGIVFFLVNVFVGVGFVVEKSTGIASIVLALFITNALLLMIFYVVSKLYYCEPWTYKPVVFLIVLGISWSAALVFYFKNVSQWEDTPAGSRSLNRKCLVLGFYDNHDVWHFLSAAGMFFAFLFLLTLDDGLHDTKRDEIHVF